MLELALTRAKFFDHLNYRLFIFGSHCRTINFISRRRFIFLFFEKAVRILSLCKFSWSFGLQPWCTGSILFKEANFSPINEGSCWNLTLQVLLSLTIWISDCLSLAHIVNIRMNLLSVLLRDGSLSSYFLWKLFEIWAYANSLVYLECSHGTLAVFIIFFYFGKQISFPINEVTCWTLCLC